MKSENLKYTIRYSLIQIAFWANFVTLLAYVSMYLLSFNISNSAIGIILGVAGIAAALIQPLVAAYADKPEAPSVKSLSLIATAGSVILAFLIFLVHGKSSVMSAILFCISIALLQFLLPFVNSLGTEMISQGIELNWGVARGLGSLAYAIVSYIMGYVVARAGMISVPVSIIITFLAMFLAIFFFPFKKGQKINEAEKEEAEKSASSPIAFFKKYPKFSIFLIGLTGAYISHVCLNSFLFQIVESKGGGSPEMGTIMSVCAMVELPVLFGFTWFLKKAECDTWVRVCSVFMALKAIATLLAPSIGALYLVQIFQMLGWGLISIAPVYYVNKVIGSEDAIKGQAYIAMTYTLGSVFASFLGGVLLDIGGVSALLIFASAASVIGAGFVVLFTERLKKQA